jgi:hypothetical protein
MVDGLETAASWGLHLAHALPSGPALTVVPLEFDADEISLTLTRRTVRRRH